MSSFSAANAVTGRSAANMVITSKTAKYLDKSFIVYLLR
jgi:hypothetical protein